MPSALSVRDHAVQIPLPRGALSGHLVLPDPLHGLVAFAHGSGSGRLSPRNRAVAETLHQAGLGTLLFDLLTETEAHDRANVFDIPLLGERLLLALDWLGEERETGRLPLGCFGASTGAAAALYAAAHRPARVGAVVSRGGRPDLAGPWLDEVRAPTLLIVGGADVPVIGLNRMALEHLECVKRLVIVPHATHLFEEPGALEQVGRLAREWFIHHLPDSGREP